MRQPFSEVVTFASAVSSIETVFDFVKERGEYVGFQDGQSPQPRVEPMQPSGNSEKYCQFETGFDAGPLN